MSVVHLSIGRMYRQCVCPVAVCWQNVLFRQVQNMSSVSECRVPDGRMCHQCVCGIFVYWQNVSSVCVWYICLLAESVISV